MRRLFPSHYFFTKETEGKYIEWVFEKSKLYIVAVGLIVAICVISITIADSYTVGFEKVLSHVFVLRLIIFALSLGLSFLFLRIRAKNAHAILFIVCVFLALLATFDTYLWVGEVGYFNPAAQIISIFFFMIVPFLNVEHKMVLGAIMILGIIGCGIAHQAELYWTLLYVSIIYVSITLVYYKFDVLLRLQFKAICEEKENAFRDQLTGVYNRNALHSFFVEDLESLKNGETIVVGILDIDCFKLYNDTYGHLAGDKVLRQFAQALISLEFDRVYRFGGEEFVFTWIIDDVGNVVLPDICSILEGHKILHKTSIASEFATVSVGMVNVDYTFINNNTINNELVDKILTCADDNLYKAKEQGRNKAIVSNDIAKLI